MRNKKTRGFTSKSEDHPYAESVRMVRATKKENHSRGFITPSEKQHESTLSCSSSERRTNARHRAFTLIELLVVIAIIGVLSAVVLASLNAARSRANTAAVKSNLNAVRTLGQEFYSVQGSYSVDGGGVYYSGDCLTNSAFFRMTTLPGTELRATADKVTQAIEAAYRAGGSVNKQCRVSADRSEYLVLMSLPTGGYWCIDSVGSAKATSTIPTTGVITC